MITILIADDHPPIRRAIRDLLEREPDIEVTAEAGDAETTSRLAVERHPDVVVFDVCLAGGDATGVTRLIADTCPDCHIVEMSLHGSPLLISALRRAGASAFIAKESISDLVTAVRSLTSGGTWPPDRDP